MPPRPAAASLAPLAVLAATLAGCGGAPEPPRPPSGYATYDRDGVSFRHPAGWVAERAAPNGPARTVVRLRPRGANPDRPGPVITLRVVTLEEGFDAFAKRSRALAAASGADPSGLEVDVPGAEESSGQTLRARGFASASVVARVGEGTGVSLDAGAPVGSEAVDAKAVVGSLRVTGGG